MPSLRNRWTTFKNGIKSMTYMLDFRPYYWVFPFGIPVTIATWLLGMGDASFFFLTLPIAMVLHFDPPTPGDSWWAMHFTEAGLVIGPFWYGVKDTN